MQRFYLLMAIVGFAAPNYFVLQQSLLTGNWLLWRDFSETFSLAFANFVASAFMSDLVVLLPVTFAWMLHEARRLELKRVWLYLVLAPLFGLSFALPLFMYARQGKLEQA